MQKWEAVIGLEIHVQLNTKSKLFSPAPNQFGDEPNINISEVCTGMPGALPVLNREAVNKAILFGLAIDAEIARFSIFDRKSYFYPDSPRNYQITQFHYPILKNGSVSVEIDGEKKEFFISHAHLEDDAGMLKHFNSFAGIDYNRAGVPLIEIVSTPCLHTPKEASLYAKTIKAIFQYLDASNCNMEEGSLRIDANISVRPKGSKELRTKVEIKNINSFSYMEMALEAEMKRQIDLYTEHKRKDPQDVILPGTYRWDAEKKETILMRTKERAEDYRYFPEPDLPPVILTDEYIDFIRKKLPQLPHERYERYTESLQLSPYNALLLVQDKKLSDYFEKALQHTKHAKLLCNWITIEFAGRLKESGKTLESVGIKPKSIATLVNLIEDKTITGKIAKSLADNMIVEPDKDPKKLIEENPDYTPMSDISSIEPLVDQVIEQFPDSIKDYKNGKTKAFAFLVGQVMRLTKGKASPDLVNQLLLKKIKEK